MVVRINKFVESLVQDLINHGHTGNRADLEMSCMQLSYAIFMAVLTPRIFTQLDLEDAGNQKTFVHSLVHKIL
ncbi:hypothetical protein SDC9_105399 [bioreactor metagenome]|uniref:Uncharacterized protein n=1 Tax=bioreactor metagenome TaxID=1076179 RepID=A0A645B0J6_9ZZZZ